MGRFQRGRFPYRFQEARDRVGLPELESQPAANNRRPSLHLAGHKADTTYRSWFTFFESHMILLLVRSEARWNGQRELSKPIQALFMLACAVALCIDIPVALALLAFAIIYGSLEWRIARAFGLDKRGYFGGHFVGGAWLSEEVCNQTVRSLRLELANTEPGHWEMLFPTELMKVVICRRQSGLSMSLPSTPSR